MRRAIFTVDSSRRFLAIVIILLLIVGMQLFFVVMHGIGLRHQQPLLIAIAAIIAAIRPLARHHADAGFGSRSFAAHARIAISPSFSPPRDFCTARRFIRRMILA